MKRLMCVALGAIAVSSAFAQFTGSPAYSVIINGDYTVSSMSTRTFPSGIVDPVILPMTLPGGASLHKAFLTWNWLYTAGEADLNKVNFNGTDVVADFIWFGVDLCWGKDGGMANYKDVTALALPGANTLKMATDRPLGSLGEGASLLAIYKLASDPLRSIDVFSGYIGSSGGSSPAPQTFSHPYVGGPAHFMTNALDGQPAADEFYINGFNVGGILPGTGGPTDAWLGVTPNSGGGYYDQAEGDVSGWMTFGDTGLLTHTLTPSDCIGHSMSAMAFVVPEPGTMIAVGAGLAALIARRRRK